MRMEVRILWRNRGAPSFVSNINEFWISIRNFSAGAELQACSNSGDYYYDYY